MPGGKPATEPRQKPAFDLTFFVNVLSLIGSIFFLLASILAFAIPTPVPPSS
jgi:hypothetical protein